MNANIQHVQDHSFKAEVLESQIPVLVDFWAEWCHPCKTMMPVIEDIANDYQGRLKIMKLNIDENEKATVEYGIRGIPTLVLFKDGNVEASKVGTLSKSQLAAFLDSHL